MRLVTYAIRDQTRAGVLYNGFVYDVGECVEVWEGKCTVPTDVLGILDAGDEALEKIRAAVKRVESMMDAPTPPCSYALDDIDLRAPILYPRKLLCLAGNYAEHVKESGWDIPDKSALTPRVFMKPPTTTINDPGAPVMIPWNGNKIDWEIELGVVIGRKARFVSAEEALDYVAGYTIVNDISERSLRVPETRTPREGDKWFDWLNGKWFDTFAPMGPCVVTKDEIDDPQNLRLTLKVNGEVMQDSSTKMMIFTIPEIIEFISSLVTLEPGDVISTGTPEGTGAARGIFLKKGDVVRIRIERIGELVNPVEAEG